MKQEAAELIGVNTAWVQQCELKAGGLKGNNNVLGRHADFSKSI